MIRTFLSILATALRGLRVGPEQRGLLGISILVGTAVWIIVFALKELVHWLFHEVLHWIEHSTSPWVLFLPLVVGALIVAVIAHYRSNVIRYRDEEGEILALNDIEGDGIERTIALYYSSDVSVDYGMVTDKEGLESRWQEPTFALTIRKFAATLATLGSGASGGLEGSAVLVGESLAAGLYKVRTAIYGSQAGSLESRYSETVIPPNPAHLQVVQLGGVAAAVATLLGTPLAAAFFASEVMYRNRPLTDKLLYALIPALVARLLSGFVLGARPLLFEPTFLEAPPVSLKYVAYLFLLGIGIAFVGQTYRLLSLRSNAWFQDGFSNRFVRLTVGALLTGIIAIVVYGVTVTFELDEYGPRLVLGSGESVIVEALDGQLTMRVALLALFAKMFATVATIGSGGSAGLLVPSLFFGSMVAAFLADLGDLAASTLVVPAMTGGLIALVNVPLTAILFGVELFGVDYMLPLLLVLIVTGLFSNPKTLYRTQLEAPDE